ncbi:MAG: PH domain-containing protein [Bdellovibrionales bacterium]
MSSYVKRAMHADEEIIYAAQLHWVIYQSGFLIALLGALLGHFGGNFVREIAPEKVSEFFVPILSHISLGVVALGALMLISAYIRQISTELVVTNHRVIAKHGYISTTSYELMMTKVEGATIDQTIWGRIWGYGTLMVKGTGGGSSPINHVSDPYKFHTYLMNSIQDSKDEEKRD